MLFNQKMKMWERPLWRKHSPRQAVGRTVLSVGSSVEGGVESGGGECVVKGTPDLSARCNISVLGTLISCLRCKPSAGSPIGKQN